MTNQKPDEVEHWLAQIRASLGSPVVIDPVVEVGLRPEGSATDINHPVVGLFVEGSENPEFRAVIDQSDEAAVICRIDLSD